MLSPDGTRIARRTARVADGAVLQGPVEIDDVATGTISVRLQGLCEYDRSDPTEPVLRQARRDHANPGCNDFPMAPFPMDTWQAHQIRWSPDGTMLAMTDLIDGYFAVWNVSDGSLIQASVAAKDPTQFAFDAAFTADSKHLVVSYTAESFTGGLGRSNALATISTSDWHVEMTREMPAGAEQMIVAGSPTNASTVAVVSGFISGGNTTLYWLDPVTLADARPPTSRLHVTEMDAVAMSEDGSRIATGAADGSIRVWDRDGRLVHELEFPGLPIRGLAFVSPSHLGVVVDDGTVRIVTIDTNELLGLARQSLTRGFTQDECERFKVEPCPTLADMRNLESGPR